MDKPMVKISKGEFTYEQQMALELLALPNKGGYTFEEIASMCNISEKQLRRWRQQEGFQKEIQRRVLMRVNEQLADVMDTTLKRAVGGSAKHSELILKSLGLLHDRHEVIAKAVPVTEQSNEDIEAEIEELKRQLGETGKEE